MSDTTRAPVQGAPAPGVDKQKEQARSNDEKAKDSGGVGKPAEKKAADQRS